LIEQSIHTPGREAQSEWVLKDLFDRSRMRMRTRMKSGEVVMAVEKPLFCHLGEDRLTIRGSFK